MKRTWVLVGLVGMLGACAKMEPGQPMKLAPTGVAPSEQAAPEQEVAPVAEEAPVADEEKAEERGAPEAPAEAQMPAAPAPADSAEAERREAPAKPKRSSMSDAPVGGAQVVCDASCQKFCANAAELDVCAKAYAAGCFTGTAPATYDCGAYEDAEADQDGVKARGTPTVTF